MKRFVVAGILGFCLGVMLTVTLGLMYRYRHVSTERLCQRACHRISQVDRFIEKMVSPKGQGRHSE